MTNERREAAGNQDARSRPNASNPTASIQRVKDKSLTVALAGTLVAAMLMGNPATASAAGAPSPMEGVCIDVQDKAQDEDYPDSPYRYQWPRSFFRAAGIHEEFMDAYRRSKMNGRPIRGETNLSEDQLKRLRTWWIQSLKDGSAACLNGAAHVTHGNIVKLAIAVEHDYMVLAIARCGLELNFVDAPDRGRTILDYLLDEIERTRGTETERIYQGHYKTLRAAGAKTRRELGDAELIVASPRRR